LKLFYVSDFLPDKKREAKESFIKCSFHNIRVQLINKPIKTLVLRVAISYWLINFFYCFDLKCFIMFLLFCFKGFRNRQLIKLNKYLIMFEKNKQFNFQHNQQPRSHFKFPVFHIVLAWIRFYRTEGTRALYK